MSQLIETKSSWDISFPLGPKACDRFRFPQSNVIMDEGEDITVKLSLKNCGGGGQGNFFYKIVKDGSNCATKYNDLLYPDENGSVTLQCPITMGTSVIGIEQIGGHYNYDTDIWEEDFHYEHTLSPRTYYLTISPTTHSSVATGDSFTISIESNTTWTVYDYKTWIHYTPSSGSGNGTITVTVDENTGTAERTGTVYVTHDGMTRSCSITQAGAEPLTCDQPVKVVNKDTGAGIEGVTVAARPTAGAIIRCTTDSLGNCTLTDLIEGDDYELVVETYPAGWECQYTVDCEEDITACETERTFRLKWTEPITCDQPVKVVDKDTPTEGIEGVIVAAWQSGAKVKDCTTGSDGKCTISTLNRDQMYDIVVESYPAGWKCEYTADCEYNMQMACDAEIVLKLKEIAPPTCEYAEHAINAKIDHDDVPNSAAEGSVVTGWIKVDGDCITPFQTTRGRVKFTFNGETKYSDEFMYDCYGETDEIPFSFTMPAVDATLIAEVQRCNASGEWENAGPKYRMVYIVTLTLYEGPHGVTADGYPIPKCTEACPDENPCVAEEGDELSFKVKIKNAGNESGMIRATFEYEGLTRCEVHEDLGAGETSEEKTLCLNQFWMLDRDIPFQIQTSHRTQLLPEVIWETDETYEFMYCYSQTSTEGYSLELNPLPEEIHVGEEIKFEGRLSNDQSKPVNNKEITIWEQDVLFDDEITSGTTESDGSFSIPWIVRKMEGFDIWGEEEAEFRAYYRKGEDDLEAKSNLQKTIIKGRSLTMAMVYGGIAVGVYIGSMFVPKFGKLVQVATIVPAGLSGYEIYLWAKDKIPSLETELEQLALPPKLSETLRKKKVLL